MKNFENADYFYNDDNLEQTIDLNEAERWRLRGDTVLGVFSELLISDRNGVYIPQIFFNNFDFKQWGLSKDDYLDLDCPEGDYYWDTWNDLLDNAQMLDKNSGNFYMLEQDGDLFARLYISNPPIKHNN